MSAPQASGARESTLPAPPRRLSVKLFMRDGDKVDQKALVPVFHRWVQQDVLDGLLIDVADYSHVHRGPGVILIAADGHYRMDEGEGQVGLEYEDKRRDGDLPKRLRQVFAAALSACQRLEAEETLDRALHFRTDEILFRINDQLLAPNSEESFEAIRPTLAGLLRKLYGDAEFRFERNAQSKRLHVRIKLSSSPSLSVLVNRAAVEDDQTSHGV